MPSNRDPEVSVFSLILEGQKELRCDIKMLAEHVAVQGAEISGMNKQVDRILNVVDNHSKTLTEHSERFSSLESSQEAYIDAYRYNKKSLIPTNKDSGNLPIPPGSPKPFFHFPPQSPSDVIKFIIFGLLGLGAVAGSIISQINF